MLSSLVKIFRYRVDLNKCSLRIFSGSAVENESTKNAPLSGVRILDFSRIFAGPFCSMLLGDLGAEIIKVESPCGDDTRTFTPPSLKDESIYFMSLNRNKKSIVIDLKRPEGIELAKELAKKSDVLIENLIPGKMAKFGLDYSSIKSINPQIIYCSISGFGSTGPYKDRASVDIIAASIGGFMHITGPKDGEPCSVGMPITDLVTGMYAHGAIMAALIQRSKSGIGGNIECDLLSSQVTMLSYVANNYLNAGVEAQRLGSLSDVLVPYEAFQTKNGYISITCTSKERFRDVCDALKVPDLPLDPKYATLQNRLENREQLSSLLRQILLTNTTEHWLKELEGCRAPYGAVNDMEGVFKDPQVIHKNMVKNVQHSKVGNVKLVGPAVTFSNISNEIRSPPPCLGEQTDEILSSLLSYSTEEIQRLRHLKVVF